MIYYEICNNILAVQRREHARKELIPLSKRKRGLLLLALLLALALGLWHLAIHPQPALTPVASERAPQGRVLLVPLDSRPPCRAHVAALGRIAGRDVVTPPGALMDYYSAPGDTAELRAWLQETIAPGDTVLLSIDQLLYGGLLAAREHTATETAQDALVAYLRALHAAQPTARIYAFSILPRLTPQDTIDGYEERRALIAYSRLVGREAAGLAIDTAERDRLRAKISDASLAAYVGHFDENARLNEKLIALTEDGTLARLVLGQDDGEPYGIPNIEKYRLQQAIEASGARARVTLTHGADEIAQTLLAACVNEQQGLSPRVFVAYAEPTAAARVMPYMAVSVDATADEKIRLIGGHRVDTPEDADLVLYLNASDAEKGSLDARAAACTALSGLVERGKPTALVDLSKHFDAREPLLPLLLARDFPLTRLTAYAGWNTTSNAVGTALAEASLALAAQRPDTSKEQREAGAMANETFLQGRILEDYFYLKEDIDPINRALKKADYTNTADLDLEHNHRWATAMLQRRLAAQVAVYKQTRSLRAPFPVPGTDEMLAIYDLRASAGFPWPRTFEIDLTAQPFFARVAP